MKSAGLQIDLTLARADFRLAIELQLPAKGVSVLFGPSGCGKTTVLRCLAGLEVAQGRVAIDKEVWQDSHAGIFRPTWQRDLGYVFQEASLFAHLNVQQNLTFGIKRAKRAGANEALAEAIELLGIGHLLARDPESLSGGERQRVAMARALALQPQLLLLDEPLASLDQARRDEILPWLERLHTQLRIPVLYVTHSMDELVRLADHVVLLETGQVKLAGPIAPVLADPEFAMAVGGQAGAILKGKVIEHDVVYGLTAIDVHGQRLWVKANHLPLGTPVRLHVHANDVSLSCTEPSISSIQNRLFGRVQGVYADADATSQIVVIQHGDQELLARITRKACETLGLTAGKPVWTQMKSVALM